MGGMAIAAAKLNPMVRFFSTPGVYIGIHFILNLIFGGLNAGGVLKNNIGGKIGNVIHALISLLVMINLGLNPLIYGGPEELKGQPLFWLLITHGIVNIIYGILVCVIPEEEANKTIKIIYSGVSSLVLIAILFFGNPELIKTETKTATETKPAPNVVKEFGKRQRRRNPPKKRKKK